MANEVNITMTAKDLASGKIKGVGDQAKSSMDKLRGMRGQFLAVGAAGAAVVGTLAMFTKSALDQQVGVNLLDNALKNIGTSYGAEKDAIEAVIGAIQDKTNFGDEEQRTSLTGLIALTGDYETSLDALGVATNIAAGLDMDLASASSLLGKVLSGNTSMLSRYGIKIDASASKTEILEILTKKFANAAEAGRDPITQLNNRLGDLAQVMGDVLLPIIDAVLPAIEKVTKEIVSFAEENPALTTTLVILAAAAGTLAIGIAGLGLAIPLAATAFGALGIGVSGAALAFVGFNIATGGILIAIGLVVAGIVALIMNWDAVVRAVKIGINFMSGAIETWANFYVAAINKIIDGVNKLAGVFGKEIGQISELEIPRISTAIEEAAEVVTDANGHMGTSMGGLQSDFTETADVAEDAYSRMAKAAITAAEDIINAKSKEVERFIEFSKKATDETRRRAGLEKLAADKTFAVALEEAANIVAASDKRYADIADNREKDLAHFLSTASTGVQAVESIEKGDMDAFADILRSVNMLPSVMQSNLNQGVPSIDKKTANIFKQMGENYMNVTGYRSGGAATKSVTGQFGFVAPTNGLGFGSKDSGSGGNINMEERFKQYVADTIALNREKGNMNPIIINGDVYGVDDLVAKIADANTQAAQLGMN